ncbi:phage tail protein [uncultured Brevundimonas sp.]|uniref:phage tail protein n=1 Tax=uncultured Brevundimonas sp. TaxID=213418 RepID=UPI0025F5182B|nr:phage tail protein [uncultured Brevundimonas sp.]
MPQVVAVAAAWVAKTITVKAVTAFVVKTVLQVAATVALSKAAKALGLSKQSVQERQASVTQLSLGEVPREAIFGMACTGGSLLDAFNYGGKYGTDTVTRVIALADHLLDGIVGYYVDDVFYNWTKDGVQPGFNGKLSIEFRNGFASGNVPPVHVRQNGGWTTNDVLAGVAHVVVDTRFDEATWTQGHPRLKFVVRGLRVYDPRRDPALGYTGPDPQTWADPSTHTFSRNAALLRYAYARGVYATGHQGEPEHLLIGRGLSAEEAPPARIIAAANLCDEVVDGEIRYTADGVIAANQAFIEVEELFAAAMAGVIVQREGGVEIEPGQAKAAVVTITDGDLVIGKPIGATPFLPDSDGGRINTIVPRYVEPSQGWLDHAAPVIRDLLRMAPAPIGDGGPREMTLALALVIRASQANSNGAIALRKAALERRATVTLPPRFAGLEEGDWIAWKSDRRHGGATVRYRVVSFSLNAEWQNSLVLEEIASSVYGVPDPVEDRALPPPAPTPIDALQLLGVNAEAITLAGETSALPAVRFTWDVNVEDTAVTAIRAEVRKVGETESAPTRIDDVARGQAVVTAGVWPDTQLECRLVPIGDPTRPVLLSNWIRVSTVAVKAGISDEAVKQIKDDLTAILDGSAEAEKVAEVLLETIMNERDSLEAEASQRIEDLLNEAGARDKAIALAITQSKAYVDDFKSESMMTFATINALNGGLAATLIEAQSYTTGSVSSAMLTVYTKAQTDAGLASTLQTSRSYTDTYKSEAQLLFSTKAERANGDASAVIEAKSYVDAYKAEASLSFPTKAQLNSAIASTLIDSKSYSDGKLAEALTTIYTKAETDAGRASSLIEAKSYTDALQSYSTLNFSTKAELNGVSGQAALALSTAVGADGKIKAKVGLATQVGNLISGIENENNGVVASVKILSSIFQLLSTSSSDRAEFADGIWYFYDGAGTARAMVGRPFGGSHKLILWCGPASVSIGSEGKDNAYVYVSMNTVGGGRFGGSDVAGGAAPLAATTSSEVATGSKPGGGYVNTNTITINVTGQGAASAVVRWVKTEQTGGNVDVYPTGRQASFQGYVAPGGLTRAIYLAVVTVPGGASVTVVQDVQLSDSN